MKHDEHQHQCAVFEWAALLRHRYPCLKFMYSTLNGERMTIRRAVRASRAGMKRGVPDIVLPVARNGFHGFYAELKAGYNKPTEDQKEYLEFLKSEGYHADWYKGSGAVISAIESYLGIEPTGVG